MSDGPPDDISDAEMAYLRAFVDDMAKEMALADPLQKRKAGIKAGTVAVPRRYRLMAIAAFGAVRAAGWGHLGGQEFRESRPRASQH